MKGRPSLPNTRTEGEGQTGVPSGGEGCLVVAPRRASLLILAADALWRAVPRLVALIPRVSCRSDSTSSLRHGRTPVAPKHPQ